MIARLAVVVALLVFMVEVVGTPPLPTVAAAAVGSALGWALDVARRRWRANGVSDADASPGEGGG